MDFVSKLLGIGTALAETAVATGEEVTGIDAVVQMIGAFAPMIILFVVFYFFLIRPQRKKDKQVKDMLAALKKDDRICTIGGIYGTIVSIKDDTVTLAVGKDNLSMVVARWAIRSVEEVAIENDMESLN